MKKIIPIMVVFVLFIAGFLNIAINFSGFQDINPSSGTNEIFSLPTAEPTPNIVQATNVNIPGQDIGNDLVLGGTRANLTTQTLISLDSPKPYENFSYEDTIYVTGHLFEDYNGNHSFDPGQDIPIPLAPINIEFGEELVELDTLDDGSFAWETENVNTVKGVRDLKIYYNGQYTINNTVWYDVDTSDKGNGRLGYNDDNDYYIDVGYLWNGTTSDWEYTFPGDGRYTYPNGTDRGNASKMWGDVVIRDDGPANFKGTWDTGDVITYDPLNTPYFGSSDQIMNYYSNPGTPNPNYGFRIDFEDELIDECTPNSYDQSILMWADEDGDWSLVTDDVGEDGVGGTGDNGDGDGLPTPGEPNVDEDLNFTEFRKASNMVVNLSLWHDTEFSARVMNSSNVETNKVSVGETITIKGTLKDSVNPSIKPTDKALKIKIFGNFMPGIIRTDNKGEFSYEYTIPEDPVIRIGTRDIDIIFNDAFYDPDYNPANASHEYLKPTALSSQTSGPVSVRLYRPTTIILEKEEYVGYMFSSISINGTIIDDNNNALTKTILNDDGSTEVVPLSAYKLRFEWGRQKDNYYDYLEFDLDDTSGNFTIPTYQIIDQLQEMGDISITISVIMNSSQTYYLDASTTLTVVVRSEATLELWIDQDNDGVYNEEHSNKIGALADYITRTEFVDEGGNIKQFNNVVVYGRISFKKRPETGLDDKEIEYFWEDTHTSYDDSGTTTMSSTKDFDISGRIEDDERGQFHIPDPNQIWDVPKIIETSHLLGPITLHVRYYDEGDYIDPIEIKKDFNIVAMTQITVKGGLGIKGENITITGRLVDDLGKSVPHQNVKLYWEIIKGDLLVDDKYDPVKLADALIGNTTTDLNGYFSLESEEILKQNVDVGEIYVVAIFDGSIPPYTPTNAYIGSSSEEVQFNISAHTRIEIDSNSKNLRLIRGRSFNIEGAISELYKGEKNPDSQVLLKIADTDQMELYIKNIEQDDEIEISDFTVNYKSKGKFRINGTVPVDLDVGTATLRVVFKGSKNGNYLGDEVLTYHEVWADTIIKILSPDFRSKELEEEGYVLLEDIKLDTYDSNSKKFVEPGLVFTFQVLELTEGVNPKPVTEGEVKLTINSSYSVFRNYSVKITDSQGYVNFTFNTPLKDTDWGYTLAKNDPEELKITVEFSGKDYYLASSLLPIYTTHRPAEKEEEPGVWTQENIMLAWIAVAFIIIFLISLFFVWRWYDKQQRIRGMRRIIKRAADQLIAGNEYQAVIFKSYQKLGVHLRKYGYLRRESETFREFEDAVRGALPIDRMSMNNFLLLLEEARYSSHQIGENQRNDAILNLRSIEHSLDSIIIDEDSAIRALERLETEGVKETKIIVGQKPSGPGPAPKGGPQLLKRPSPPKPKLPGKTPVTTNKRNAT